MIEYLYDEKTKEYLGKEKAFESPLEKGNFLLSANATFIKSLPFKEGYIIYFDELKENWEYIEIPRVYTYDIYTKEYINVHRNTYLVNYKKFYLNSNETFKEPLSKKENHAICFDEEKAEWEYIEDNRNLTVYETSTKQELKVNYLGAIKNEHTLLKPTQFDKWDDATKSWIKDTEAVAKHEKAQAKIQKEEELKSLTIDINTVLYDANQEALGNFATVISIANATFNKAISIGIDGTVMSLEDAYNYVYKEHVHWKGADNEWHTVQISSIVQTAEDAMTKKAEILAKY